MLAAGELKEVAGIRSSAQADPRLTCGELRVTPGRTPDSPVLLQWVESSVVFWVFLRLAQDECISENCSLAFSMIFRRELELPFLKINPDTIIKKSQLIAFLYKVD